jgi:carbonic anhydrase/acetyltransferase-like protein (isoleucine patch superfamily)
VIIGMGAIVMNDAVIPDFCIVAAGALVSEGKTYPSGSLILGSTARAVRPLSEEEKQSITSSSLHYVQAAKEQLSSR